MSIKKLTILSLVCILGFGCTHAEQTQDSGDFADASGLYLGLTSSGEVPEIFAPGLISTDKDEAGVIVFPDGKEILFWVMESIPGADGYNSVFYVTKELDGAWTEPELISFYSEDYQDMYPALHPDGSRLFFQSDRPIDPTESRFTYNIWYVDRVGDDWGEPRSIGRPINGSNHTGGASVSRDGTLYYTVMNIDSGYSKLYRSEFSDGVYQTPVRLPDHVNAYYQTTDSYVDPEDRYLVFTAFERQGHVNNPGDLFVAFRNDDGTWTDAERLGSAMNTDDQFGSVTISADGQYIFFMRASEPPPGVRTMGWDIYWIEAALAGTMNDPPEGD